MKAKNNRFSIFNYNILTALFMVINTGSLSATRMYLFLTPSHEQMFSEFFSPSFCDDYELVIRRYEQSICPSGTYMKGGWNQTMLKKVEMLIDACADPENDGEVFLYSDVDIQFFKPTRQTVFDLMADPTLDMVIQRDDPQGTACAGFLACRASERTRQMWCQVRDIMLKDKRSRDTICDQKALNIVIAPRNNHLKIRWKFLPNTFMGPGTLKKRLWNPGQSLAIPKGVVMHHANYTHGIPNKLKQLAYVRNLVLSR